MAVARTGQATLADYDAMPETNRIVELIDGEIIVSPTPTTQHARVVFGLARALYGWTAQHGGEVLVAPVGVRVPPHPHSLEPDVLLVLPEHLHHIELAAITGPPDLVAEVSSPSNRHRDLGRKREIYEAFGVPEYWFVDLRDGCVVVHRLADSRSRPPRVRAGGDTLTTTLLPGFALPVADLFT